MRETVAYLCSYCIFIIIGDYVKVHRINESVRARYATLVSITPVEAVSPPFIATCVLIIIPFF